MRHAVVSLLNNNHMNDYSKYLIAQQLQGGPAKVKPTYIFDSNI